MSFMQEEITDKQTWLEIDGSHGITFVPMDVLSKEEFNAATLTSSNVSEHELNEVFGKYYEGKVQDICLTVGYGARYMDCTEWSVFDTEQEAQDYLTATYGDEEEEN